MHHKRDWQVCVGHVTMIARRAIPKLEEDVLLSER